MKTRLPGHQQRGHGDIWWESLGQIIDVQQPKKWAKDGTLGNPILYVLKGGTGMLKLGADLSVGKIVTEPDQHATSYTKLGELDQ